MNLNPGEWSRLEQAFTAWAEGEPALRAAIAVGSRMRSDPPPDEWSDLDLLLFVNGHEDFARDSGWLAQIGEVWVAIHSRTVMNDPEWLVTYAGGYNIDFVLIEAERLSWLAQMNPLPEPVVRGYKVLVDKDGLTTQIPPAPGKPSAPPLPEPEEYQRLVASFWYMAYYTAKQIRRGELVLVKFADGRLKQNLLTMLAWHASAVRGAGAEIWHNGRFMQRWADPQARQNLPDTFGLYDAQDSYRALIASLELFRRLARETAACLGTPYPEELDERMSGLITALGQG